MASETKTAKNQKNEGSSITVNHVSDDDIEEVEVQQNKTLKDYGIQVMEGLASTPIGQMIFEKTDRVLKILEETTKWSLPQDDPDLHLERPLPWVFFLPLIIWLRVFRIWLSIGAYVVFSQTVTPHNMVNFIQTQRRQLRALRMHGLRAIQKNRLNNQAIFRSSINLSFIDRFRYFLNSLICKPGQYCDYVPVSLRIPMSEHTKERSQQSSKRPRDDDSRDLNLTVNELLEKYAKIDSDGDSDYIPEEEDYDDDDNDNESINSSMSTEEVTLEENPEESSEATLDAVESIRKDTEVQNTEVKDTEVKVKEIEVNGNSNEQAKPVMEPLSAAETDNKQVQTPKEKPAHENGPSQAAEQNNGDSESKMAPTEEVENNHSSTPKSKQEQQQNQSAATLEEKNQKTASPSCETAALKLSTVGSNKQGSPQEFPSTFHPTPVNKDSTPEAQTSTPKKAKRPEDVTSPDKVVTTSGGPERNISLNHSNRMSHHYQSHQNSKRRNRNRR